jgi:hypothetical protein
MRTDGRTDGQADGRHSSWDKQSLSGISLVKTHYKQLHVQLSSYTTFSVVWSSCRERAKLSSFWFYYTKFPKSMGMKVNTDLCKLLNKRFRDQIMLLWYVVENRGNKTWKSCPIYIKRTRKWCNLNGQFERLHLLNVLTRSTTARRTSCFIPFMKFESHSSFSSCHDVITPTHSITRVANRFNTNFHTVCFQGLPLNRIQVWCFPLRIWLDYVHCSSRVFVALLRSTLRFTERHSVIQRNNARSDFLRNVSSNSTIPSLCTKQSQPLFITTGPLSSRKL